VVAALQAERERAGQFNAVVESGDTGLARQMIAQGANLDARVDHYGRDGSTPLVAALGDRNLPMVRLLLEAGASPDRDVFNISNSPYRLLPLHMAIRIATRDGDLEFMRTLLEAGASPNITMYDNGEVDVQISALAVAIGPGDRNTEVVRELIERGADTDVTYCTDGGHCRDWTNLGLAVARGNIDLVRLFIEAGNPLIRDTETDWSSNPNPLMEAAKYGRTEILAVLRDEFGVNLGAKDYFGCTTLDYAIATNQEETAEFLRNAGVVAALDDCDSYYVPRPNLSPP
jgi:ankyrin repeat protein